MAKKRLKFSIKKTKQTHRDVTSALLRVGEQGQRLKINCM